MMANITGARMTSNIAATRRMVDMAKDIALLDPNEGPFVTFLKALGQSARVVYDPKFEWLEDDRWRLGPKPPALRRTPLPRYRWRTAPSSVPGMC